MISDHTRSVEPQGAQNRLFIIFVSNVLTSKEIVMYLKSGFLMLT